MSCVVKRGYLCTISHFEIKKQLAFRIGINHSYRVYLNSRWLQTFFKDLWRDLVVWPDSLRSVSLRKGELLTVSCHTLVCFLF